MEKPLYEAMIVFRTDQGEENLNAAKGRFLDVIKSHGASITKQDEWGKRRLAYPVLKQMEGYFLNLYLQGETTLVDDLKAFMRTDTNILRGLILRITKAHLEEDARKARLAEEAAQRAAAEAQARAEAKARAEAAAAEAAAAEAAAGVAAATALAEASETVSELESDDSDVIPMDDETEIADEPFEDEDSSEEDLDDVSYSDEEEEDEA